MKILKQLLCLSLLFFGVSAQAQVQLKPNSADIKKSNNWKIQQADVEVENDVIHMKVKGDGIGLLWTDKQNFGNGKIEFDVKGKDQRGENFVGLAFHMEDDQNYDCIYFRPFNFHSKEKANFAVQYMSMPDNGWRKLRQEHPGVYENAMTPKVDPNDWFHVTIVVNHPEVEVYVNDAKEATLTVKQISTQAKGNLGLWVSYRTEGWFKNLVVTPEVK